MNELETLLEDLRDLRDQLNDHIEGEEPESLKQALDSLEHAIDQIEDHVNAA